MNPQNTQLLTDFLSYLRSIQRSETTIAGYENDIQIAWVWCLQNNANTFFVDWTKRNIVSYQNWLLNNNGNSPARIRRLKASLSSLSNYIENVLDDEFPTFRNIISKVENPVNQPVRDKTVLSEEQIKTLLDTLTIRKKYDKACMVALAAFSGRRKAELPRFKVSDFDDDHLVCGGALYKSSPIKTKGRGVNGKPLACFTLAKKFKPYFDAWMDYRKENGIESEWLFPQRSNPSEQIGIGTLNSWAVSFSNVLGVDFYWHCLRHAAVTNLVRAGIPDTVVQQFIGWEDISMVPVYVDIDADEQLSMYFKDGDINVPDKKDISEL